MIATRCSFRRNVLGIFSLEWPRGAMQPSVVDGTSVQGRSHVSVIFLLRNNGTEMEALCSVSQGEEERWPGFWSRRKVAWMNGLWRPVADISLFLPAMMIGAEGRAVWGSLVRPRGVQPSWNALSMKAEEKREANPQPPSHLQESVCQVQTWRAHLTVGPVRVIVSHCRFGC